MNIKNDSLLDIALADYKVYKHTSPSGKVYIGITRDELQHRWRGGNGYANNSHFFRAIKKYGWQNFKHEVLFAGLTEEQAVRKEKELIALYDSTDPTKGYNRDPGGGVRSRETSAKISAALTGVPHDTERRRRQSERQKGSKLSPERKQQISEAHKHNPKVLAHIIAMNKARAGQPKTSAHKTRLSQSQPRRRVVINLDTGETFQSIHAAAASCGGSHPNIVKACTGERQRAYGFRWAYGSEGGNK